MLKFKVTSNIKPDPEKLNIYKYDFHWLLKEKEIKLTYKEKNEPWSKNKDITFYRNGKGYNCDVTTEVGLALCESLVAYDNGDYAKAVDLVSPVRYQVIKIGGSHAQVCFVFGPSMLFNFVLVWLYKYFDMSVTDESYVDETRVWRTKL